MGGWRGNFNMGFRDESLNARNAFATEKGPEQQKRFMFGFQGPIAKGKTSLSVNADGNMAYDAQTIVARTPTGEINDQVRRPTDGVNTSVRIEQALGPTNSLRAEYARRNNVRSNLGVGDFDLTDRAYETEQVNDTLRVRNTRTIGKKLFSELRVEFARSETTTTVGVRDTDDPRARFVHVGRRRPGRRARGPAVHRRAELRLHHQEACVPRRRAGRRRLVGQQYPVERQRHVHVLEPRRLTSSGRPRTFTRRVGDPNVGYSQYEAGWYIQDDFRVEQERSTSASALRQEMQTQRRRQVEHRSARGVHAGRSRKGTVRGGYGMFFDWMDSNIYEQTVRVDGTHQIDEVIINPSYPDFTASAGTAPAGQPHRPGAESDAADDSSGVDRLRPAVRRMGQLPDRLHDDARHRHAAVDQRQRADHRRASGPDRRQHHRRSGRPASGRRIASPSARCCGCPIAGSWAT